MREVSLDILELACNSLDAGASQLTVEITRREDVLRVRITDNGDGMTAEAVCKALEGGYSTKGSTGLGVSLARANAEEAGGYIKIYSAPQKGTETLLEYVKGWRLGDLGATVAPLLTESTVLTLRLDHDGRKFEFCSTWLNGDKSPAAIRGVREDINNFLTQYKEQ